MNLSKTAAAFACLAILPAFACAQEQKPNSQSAITSAAKSAGLDTFSARDAAHSMRIDASDPQKLQESYVNLLLALDDATQQSFAQAMAILGVVLSENPALGGDRKMKEILDGKTADEIIAAARRLTPYIGKHSDIVNAKDKAQFSASIGKVLVGLDAKKQAQFSEAVAKILYDAEKKKTPEADLMRRLDGKTADEIIKMAGDIDLPFDTSSNFKEFKIAPITGKERTKIESNNAEKYGKNLVPKAD